MTTTERLESYYPFAGDVIDNVAEVAGRQKSFETYQQFFDNVGVGQAKTYELLDHQPVSILDVRRKEEESVLMVHLPMANPLDSNQKFQVATIAATNPTTRVIAAGNPSSNQYRTGLLDSIKRRELALDPSWAPLVEPLEHYADLHGIE